MASELQLTPLEAWQHLHRLVENINALTATLVGLFRSVCFLFRFIFYQSSTNIAFILYIYIFSDILKKAFLSTCSGLPGSNLHFISFYFVILYYTQYNFTTEHFTTP